MTSDRNKHFYGITFIYVILGLLCLFLKKGGDAEIFHTDFFLQGAVTIGISLLYLLIAGLTLWYHNNLMREYIHRIPKTPEDIAIRAKAQGVTDGEIERHVKTIKKSTGYAKLLGMNISVYAEIQFLRDFGRILAPLALILVLNLGWNDFSRFSIPLLTLVAAFFLWLSSSRYQKELDFIQSLTPQLH
ncbi:MAG: hypothetical protein ABIP97_03540 [Chthoniobacterales bacterium]